MSVTRRRRGFAQAARLPPSQLGLPEARARELVLSVAWRDLVGETLARRAHALGIRRGVLEIAVDDERWLATVRDLVPRLAGRLAAAHPELGVRKFRLRRTRGPLGEGAEPIELPGAESPPGVAPRPQARRAAQAVERRGRVSRRAPPPLEP